MWRMNNLKKFALMVMLYATSALLGESVIARIIVKMASTVRRCPKKLFGKAKSAIHVNAVN